MHIRREPELAFTSEELAVWNAGYRAFSEGERNCPFKSEGYRELWDDGNYAAMDDDVAYRYWHNME